MPLRERFEEVFDVPVFVEDNIRSLAFAELLRGAGQGCRNFLCLSVRSGVGLGIVIDGKLYVGSNAMSGEVGYTVFPTDHGPKTMTDLLSAKRFIESTLQTLRSRQNTTSRRRLIKQGDKLSLTDIISVAEAGDELLQEQLGRLGIHLGMVVANLANLFSPEKIVLSGEVPDCSTIVHQEMERTFRKFTLPQILKMVYLENGALSAFAGALGVAYVGFTKTFSADEETLICQAKDHGKLVG